MDSATLLELFGYLGSLIVIVSMLMTSVMRLRIINTIGSLMFSAYALMIHSYPTMLMNLVLAAINLWHIMKLHNHDRHYDLIEVSRENGVLRYILNTFKDDIESFFPGFDIEDTEGCEGYIVLCQSSPAGVMLARRLKTGDAGAGAEKIPGREGDLEVLLDYTTPAYRDCSVGKFLYNSLATRGYGRLIVDDPGTRHRKYLRKMGFSKDGGESYTLKLRVTTG